MPLERFFSPRTLVLAVCAAAAFSLPAYADSLQDISRLMKQGQQSQALDFRKTRLFYCFDLYNQYAYKFARGS